MNPTSEVINPPPVVMIPHPVAFPLMFRLGEQINTLWLTPMPLFCTGGGIMDTGGGFVTPKGGFMDTGGGFIDTGGGFIDTGGGIMDTGSGFLTPKGQTNVTQ
jgi:hypothetical protein